MRFLLIILFLTPLFTNAQTTAIPDANFEQALINLGLDTGIPDGFIPTANIDTIINLSVFNNISDLTGIEDFTALQLLNCANNNVLSSINVTNNLNLKSLHCYGNSISSIDLTQNTALEYLHIAFNLLTSLDVTQNTQLNTLFCKGNQLTSLDLSQNTLLGNLGCDDNQISSLNISVNTNLYRLLANNNLLTCLNVKNTNNSNFTEFNVSFNPNLTCIQVDDTTYSNANWTNIDAQHYFSTNCSNPCTVGIDETNKLEASIYPNPTTGNFTVDLGEVKRNVKATLSNSLGQTVFTEQYTSTALIELTIQAPAGIYFLQLETANESKTIKILKE